MNAFRQRRAWFWVAIAAIVIALVALLVPHGHIAGQSEWLALLPVFFVGLLAPLSLMPVLANLAVGCVPAAPVLVPSFERPPPSRA